MKITLYTELSSKFLHRNAALYYQAGTNYKPEQKIHNHLEMRFSVGTRKFYWELAK